MYKRLVTIIGIAAFVGLMSTAVFAEPQGGWRGSIQKGNQSIPVEALFTSKKVEIHFLGFAACTVKADYDKADGRSLVYKFGLSTNGGPFCDGLLNGRLEIRHADGDEDMTVSFSSDGTWAGSLQKDNSSS